MGEREERQEDGLLQEGQVTLTVKKLFAGKPIKRGGYRLKLSADRNSKTLRFKIT